MSQIADFHVKISQEDAKFKITLKDQGDDFEVEVEDAGDLMDEVDELLNERLAKYGVTTREA